MHTTSRPAYIQEINEANFYLTKHADLITLIVERTKPLAAKPLTEPPAAGSTEPPVAAESIEPLGNEAWHDFAAPEEEDIFAHESKEEDEFGFEVIDEKKKKMTVMKSSIFSKQSNRM